MSLRMSIVIGVLVVLAALAAWFAAMGLTACVAWAGDAPPAAPPAPPEVSEVRVVRIATPRPLPAKPATPATPPREARAPLPPMPDEVSARGWFGMQFTCTECTIRPRTADAAPVWDFSDPPEVYRVEPGGPAARGGIQPGDVLLRIDGTPIDSPDGGRRFGAVEPGQKVSWTVKRGPRTRTLVVTAGERPGQLVPRELMLAKLNAQLAHVRELQDMTEVRRAVEQARAQLAQLQFERAFQGSSMRRPSAMQQPLRYEGTVGCSDVDVHGASGVNVTVSQEGDEIVITTCDAVVRVKAGEKR